MPRFSTRLVTAARQDLGTIRRYSLKQWGQARTQEYLGAIWRALDALGQFPEQGRVVGEQSGPVRRIVTGRHVIYYRVLDERSEIEILRIIHDRIDQSPYQG